jgi:lipoyl(octanoyl) transferase
MCEIAYLPACLPAYLPIMKPLHVRRLGLVPYGEALELQRGLVEDRRAGHIPDTLLLLQHPHVLTLGVRGSGRANILATPEHLAARGVHVFDAGRGGDVTYHGPGQIVGYPVIDLRPDRQDVHRYVRDLEEVLIRVCADFGIPAARIPGLTGAWVDRAAVASSNGGRPPAEKIAAIGVRIARWITSHGFAFNVNVDLDYFQLIVPCGIQECGVTSLQALLGQPIEISKVEARVIAHFADVFECEAKE